jgi:hypothetical protein
MRAIRCIRGLGAGLALAAIAMACGVDPDVYEVESA